MKENLNEELARMMYLSGHKRGVVISEQSKIDEQLFKKLKNWNNRRKQKKGQLNPKNRKDTGTQIPNWGGKTNGRLDFDMFIQHLALNVAGDYNLNITHIQPRAVEKKEPPKSNVIINPLDLRGKDMPFHDNMINPDFQDPKHKGAETKYKNFINKIATYLKSNGKNKEGKSPFDSIRKITITGEADAAPPTTKSPFDLRKDHATVNCNQLFCGLTDKDAMNVWLATNRAIRFGNRVVEDIKNLTGIDISSKITYGTPISHYDSNYKPGDKEYDKYRGEEFRSVSLVPDADEIEVVTLLPQDEVVPDQPKEGEQFYNITDTIKLPLLPQKTKGGWVYKVRPELVEKYKLRNVINVREGKSFNGIETPKAKINLGDLGQPGDVDYAKKPDSITIGNKEYKFNTSDSKTNPDYSTTSGTIPYRTDSFPLLEVANNDYYFTLAQFTLTKSY